MKLAKSIHTVTKFAITGLIGFFMFLNILPWVSAASMIAGNAPGIGGMLSALFSIPFLGGVIQFIVMNVSTIAGIILWATVQGIQILPTLIERPTTLKPLIQSWEGNELPEKRDGSRLDGLRKTFNNSLNQIIDNLKFYRGVAYCIEAIVCLYVYPPYVGGWGRMANDFPVIDTDAINFPNILSAIVTMFAFEVLFRIALNIWGLTEIMTMRKPEKPAQ
jgi:hypothetical protein